MRQAGEPTVEEILESIKQVIARDGNPDADHLGAEPLAEKTSPEESLIDEGASVLDLAENAECIDAVDFEDCEDDDNTVEAPLVNEIAKASMRESLAALSVLSKPGAQPQIVRSGETSLEGLVRDLLRPALAEWLDTNLPPLVERMVAAEIKRIVGKKS